MPFIQARICYELEIFTLSERGSCRVCGAEHETGAKLHGFRVELPGDRLGFLPYCPPCAPLGTSYEDMMARELGPREPACTCPELCLEHPPLGLTHAGEGL